MFFHEIEKVVTTAWKRAVVSVVYRENGTIDINLKSMGAGLFIKVIFRFQSLPVCRLWTHENT